MLVKLERIASQAEETAGTQAQSHGGEEGGTGTKDSPLRLARVNQEMRLGRQTGGL